MAEYGVTDRGFIRKGYEVLLDENQQKAREVFGPDVDLSLNSPVGAFVALLSWDHAGREERSEQNYYAAYLSSAEGVSLDRVARIGGGSRDGVQSASAELLFNGTPGATVPATTECETSQGLVFATVQDLTLDENGEGTVFARCLTAGPVGIVPDDSITTIKTPIAGIDTVTNPADSIGGRLSETDPDFKERYASESEGGGSSVDAIEEAVERLEGVVLASGFANRSNATDLNGSTGEVDRDCGVRRRRY